MNIEDSPIFRSWLTALDARHLSDLRVSDVTRALRALSSAYVERRDTAVRGALDSAGKRAAFALFYAPLHFLVTYRVVRALDAHIPPPHSILDIGCGTGAAGAAWAIAADGTPVTGIDRHPWAVAEAGRTYRELAVNGRARRSDVGRLPLLHRGTAVVAGYLLNELPPAERKRLQERLVEAAGRGVRILIIEPIGRRLVPWWPSAEAQIRSVGGRADEWRFPVDLPPSLRLLDKAAGLNHRELTARSLYCPGSSSRLTFNRHGPPDR
ncbi:MAG: methyltransferase domain-containing protein [Vicinamibacterales bacterium]